MKMASGLPDPVITASIYCTDHLDHVIFRALRPFQDRAQEAVNGEPLFLWIIRYGKSGEHVKVRIHSSPDQREVLRQILEDKVHELFTTLPPSSLTRKILNWAGAQAVDPEDRVDRPYPDRSLLWTTYRRSHVSLGPSLLLEDDRYVELSTLCLAAAADLLFALHPHFSGQLAYRFRHSTLVKALFGGIDALGLPPEKAAKYLLYHRDWVLRFCVLKNWWDREQAAKVVKLFDRRIDEQSLLEPTIALQKHATEGLNAGPDQEWRAKLREFFLYVSAFDVRTEGRLEPFAELPWHPPLFKVLQGLSNQLGMQLLDEAFVHHTLLSAFKRRYSLGISTDFSDGEPSGD